MGRLDVSGAAARAGVETAFIARLVELGLLDVEPDGSLQDGQVHRAQMLQAMERVGVSLEGIATVARRPFDPSAEWCVLEPLL